MWLVRTDMIGSVERNYIFSLKWRHYGYHVLFWYVLLTRNWIIFIVWMHIPYWNILEALYPCERSDPVHIHFFNLLNHNILQIFILVEYWLGKPTEHLWCSRSWDLWVFDPDVKNTTWFYLSQKFNFKE